MREFKEAKEEFDLRGYRVVWINTDSIRSHRGWRAKMNVPFRMLSDASGKASKLFGVFIENENGLLKRFSNRAIFVIQEDGCITYKWVADQPAVSPDLKQVIASLDRKMDVNR